uniref:Uncharacterized protein n=1 Tax=Minutocellus polymorphus TaxID=265543 RepID=A0A7S0AUA5_9STRA|mmetsp:Transcript_3967/g.6851  ORF Transcript_3967/g.6851 Transcript_3967/m.6851 type:complete len:165 (+) Transcript_3967:53-547(+)|eukprot:CAMPEP_0197716100 /NCGR_PEP_ID=MMETSP1434-20131217/1116_1 /TAXON_ID=265543 /ORGANISM="Minutocellus polymorphus, Strain CCMP3303" /LENGTH=164 /DNA_ID=CAMNT_0043300407 /DNA_START=45 /DNA_END=539 /DNA_ORIENTATION=+
MTVSSSNTKLLPEIESVIYHPSASAPPAAGIPTAHATIVADTDEARLTASAPPGKTIVTKSTYTIPADKNSGYLQATTAPQSIPPGAKPGGTWMSQHYVGPITGGATCACVLLVFLPGVFMLCFPMDKRYVYQEPGPNGRLLSGSGRVVKGGSTPKVLPPYVPK